jgi:hypothetical protein
VCVCTSMFQGSSALLVCVPMPVSVCVHAKGVADRGWLVQIRKRAHYAVRQLLAPGQPAAAAVARATTRTARAVFAQTTTAVHTGADTATPALYMLVFLKDALHLLPLAVRAHPSPQSERECVCVCVCV